MPGTTSNFAGRKPPSIRRRAPWSRSSRPTIRRQAEAAGVDLRAVKAMHVDSFAGYLDRAAREGVTVSALGRHPINLGLRRLVHLLAARARARRGARGQTMRARRAPGSEKSGVPRRDVRSSGGCRIDPERPRRPSRCWPSPLRRGRVRRADAGRARCAATRTSPGSTRPAACLVRARSGRAPGAARRQAARPARAASTASTRTRQRRWTTCWRPRARRDTRCASTPRSGRTGSRRASSAR